MEAYLFALVVYAGFLGISRILFYLYSKKKSTIKRSVHSAPSQKSTGKAIPSEEQMESILYG